MLTTVDQAAAIAIPPLTAPVDSRWNEDEGPVTTPRLVSLYAPAPAIGAAAFVGAARGRERFYWAEPGDALVLAGAGIAAHLMAAPTLPDELVDRLPAQRFAEIEAQARALFDHALIRPLAGAMAPDSGNTKAAALARPRLFGGFAFQDDFVPDNTWSLFSPAEFILPHYQLARRGETTYLTINTIVGPEEDLTEVLDALAEALEARLADVATQPPISVGPTFLRYPMTRDQWGAVIEEAVAAIAAGTLAKVVLARVCEVRATGAIDAAAPLAFLDANYSDSYRFLFEPCPNHAFIGATPELLVRKSGRSLETMALAGSIGRGRTPEEDDMLAGELLMSTKDRHEHQLVVDAIRAHLAPATDVLTIPSAPAVLRLRNIQHLLTPVTGRLRQADEGLLPLVRRLHPTPAMGGVPPERALAFLRRTEPVPRGWYAAPIGWMDSEMDGVFAVGIRSAVTQHDRAWLYAGAGIVAESTPEREWAETALKFRPMLGALGVKGDS